MTQLGDHMRSLADAGHARADELREHAQHFDNATAAFHGEVQTIGAKQFLGAWARARRLYADCTGEPLV